MKNDILMFHRLMRAMPLHREMSVDEICRAVQGEEVSVLRALQIDKDAFFEQFSADWWKRVRDYKPIGHGTP